MALRKVYPTYSLLRTTLFALNMANQIGPRFCAPGMRQLAKIDGASLPPLKPGMARAFLLHKLNQNGRIYIFDFGADGTMTSMTKLATTDNAATGLRREAEILHRLAGKTNFAVPELLTFTSWEEGAMLQISAAPEGFSPHDKAQPIPDSVFVAVSKLRASEAPAVLPANAFASWQSIAPRIAEPTLRSVSTAILPDTQFATGAAHSDMGSENIFSRHPAEHVTDFFLIDWEFFAEVAPALTDRVGVWLGHHHRDFKGRNRPERAALAKEFLDTFDSTLEEREAAILALVHLAYIGIDLAWALIGDRGPSKE